MNRTKIVPKTDIEMGHRGWNVFEGHCPYKCWYCWSCANKHRFKEPESLQWKEERFNYRFPKEPSRILVCWTIDLFHPLITCGEIVKIIKRCNENRQHTFIFLTKNPTRYVEFNFPENCWLGVTVTKNEDLWRMEEIINRFFQGLKKGKIFRNKIFVSIEPFLEDLDVAPLGAMDWIIVGALTGPRTHFHIPKKEWIRKIIDRAKPTMAISGMRERIPVFMKNNLKRVWGKKLIQEFPCFSQKQTR